VKRAPAATQLMATRLKSGHFRDPVPCPLPGADPVGGSWWRRGADPPQWPGGRPAQSASRHCQQRHASLASPAGFRSTERKARELRARSPGLLGTSVRVLLDTHVWLWWLLGSERLSASERRALDQLAASGNVCLAAMSLWEAQTLRAKGRLILNRPFPVWLRQAAATDVVQLLPLDAVGASGLVPIWEAGRGSSVHPVFIAEVGVGLDIGRIVGH